MVKSYLRAVKRGYRQSRNALMRPFDERWMYDQFIPVQSITRSALEYDLSYYGADEFHVPPSMTDTGLSELRELPLNYNPVALPKPYYFTVKDAVIYGTEIVAMDNPERYFMELLSDVTLPVEGINHQAYRNIRRRALSYGKSARYDFETAYLFPGRGFDNYYHFIMDSCLRFVDLEDEGAITSSTTLLVHDISRQWQRDYLSLLNVPEDTIAERKNQFIKVKNLTIASPRRQRHAVSKIAIASFNRRIRANLNLEDTKAPKRILISRSLANARRVKNEDELIAALVPYGFTVVHLEEMSVAEQVMLFANAECIVGPHGAGLANIIYAEAPLVVEFFPFDAWGWGFFIALTHAVGGTHRAIVGTRQESSEKEFSVNVASVVRALDEFQL